MFELAWVEKNGYRICIPTPASYVAQKLFINPARRPEHKRPQDILKVKVLLQAMDGVPGQMESLEQLLGKLPVDKRDRILKVAKDNSIALPWKPASD